MSRVMTPWQRYAGGVLALAVTAALVVAVSLPAGASDGSAALPVDPTSPLPLPLPTSLLPSPTPTLPGVPSLPGVPTVPGLPTVPGVNPPAPPVAQPPPGPAGPPTGPGGASTAGAGPAGTAPPAGPALLATDPGADAYPQPPVDPATTPSARLVAQLNAVQHRVQYLQNVIARMRSDLAVAQGRAGPVVRLVTLLAGAPPAQQAVDPTGRLPAATPDAPVVALAAAVASGETELEDRQSQVQELQQVVNGDVARSLVTSLSSRLRRPVPGGITSPFGNRFDPYYQVWQLHAGIDIGAPLGTPIVAAAAGRVTQAGWAGGYGNYTCVYHGIVNGQRLSTCYAHQQRILVSPGQQVDAGQVIGNVGATGAAIGPHLHFEVRLGGRPVDPMPWL
jgi:murein DD-endopeptidase MepM/ murein hydrolase activator NlpD